MAVFAKLNKFPLPKEITINPKLIAIQSLLLADWNCEFLLELQNKI